uniref:Methyltransf_21 domain-containing protein n=1 Tax=Caenorhabditis tropicalis TaxID=1561998 RepID=A0A1I7TFD2_9PELO
MMITSKPFNRLKEAFKHNRNLSRNVLLGMVLLSSVFLFISVLKDQEEFSFDVPTEGSPTFEAFYNCVYPKLAPLKGNYEKFWTSFVNLTKECDNLEEYKSLDIQPVANTDEVKYVSFPKREENITMVTLGIGHDVDAEMRLKKLWPRTEFFGVDPSPEINKDLYEVKLGGNYFQVAVSGQGGMQKSYIFR